MEGGLRKAGGWEGGEGGERAGRTWRGEGGDVSCACELGSIVIVSVITRYHDASVLVGNPAPECSAVARGTTNVLSTKNYRRSVHEKLTPTLLHDVCCTTAALHIICRHLPGNLLPIASSTIA